jgi:hypothetical protein
MCLPVHQQNRRTRTLLCIGIFCLALSVGMQNFRLVSPNLHDFLRGMLIGIAITVNFYAAWLSKRMRCNGHA